MKEKPVKTNKLANDKTKTILALGAESAGNFCVYNKGEFYHSPDFGDLLDGANFENFQKEVFAHLKKNKLKPNIILTDLHPDFKTTLWGKELAKKYKAEFIQIQHHLAHIFSAVGEHLGTNWDALLPSDDFIGIACDGTGYGFDENIWGGEVFSFSKTKSKIINNKLQITNKCQSSNFKIQRIGHLENQTLIGGDLTIREPARMLISILNKFLPKDKIYNFVKKYYSKQEFEVLYNQLQQNFNCQETSSAGRILDAVSLLLGFCGNERKYKHEAINLLEKNSIGTEAYRDIEPIIEHTIASRKLPNREEYIEGNYTLSTTTLFEYLIKSLSEGKDKKRLAVTAQLYIAKGLYEIIAKSSIDNSQPPIIFAGGGLTNNKIILEYFESKGVIINKKKLRGDAGISFGQICYYLLN